MVELSFLNTTYNTILPMMNNITLYKMLLIDSRLMGNLTIYKTNCSRNRLIVCMFWKGINVIITRLEHCKSRAREGEGRRLFVTYYIRNI